MQRLAGSAARRTQRQSKRPGVVVAERAGQQAGAGQHLEAVADADDRAAAGDERPQPFAEPTAVGEGEVEGEHAAGAEGVAVAEPAGDDEDAGGVEQPGRAGELAGEHDGRLGPGEVERQHGIGVPVRPRPGDTIAPGRVDTDLAPTSCVGSGGTASRGGDGDGGEAGERQERARR